MLAEGQGYRGGTGQGTGQGFGSGMSIANSQIITIDIIIGIGNICLLLILLYMYVKSYREFKSKFTFGLLLFASLLLLQNVLFTGFYYPIRDLEGPVWVHLSSS